MSVVPYSAIGSKSTIDDTDEIMMFVPSEPIIDDKNKTINGADIKVYTENTTLHTGIRNGLAVTINVDATKLDVAAGNGIIVNRDPDPLNTTVTVLDFPSATLAIVDPNLGDAFSHVYLNSSGIFDVETTFLESPQDIHDRIFLATLAHQGGNIVRVMRGKIVAHGTSSAEIENMVFGGGVTLSGGKVSANGANLMLNITSAILQQFGRGFPGNKNTPNTVQTSDAFPIPISSFRLVFIDGSGDLIIDGSSNVLDPIQFNSGGSGTLVNVSNNAFTVFRGFQTDDQDVILYYGTEEFMSADAAINAAEPTWVEDELTRGISPVVKIVIKKEVTDIEAGLIAGDVIIKSITSRTQLP